jgi:uncharacterized protein DUF5134
MASLGQHMLSLPASIFWIAGLCGVLVFHCVHLARGCAECRALHGVHLVMLVGMLYMFAAMAFQVAAVLSGLWLGLYVATSAGVFAWIATGLVKRESVSGLWVLALAQQVAMIYMWAPMRDWAPAVSYGFAFYFALETLGWAIKASSRGVRRTLLLATAGPARGALLSDSLLDDACMAVMAASMAYMFLGMQLLMSTPRGAPQTESFVVSHPVAPSEESVTERPAFQQEQGAVAQRQPSPLAPAGGGPVRRYVIRPGDTLIGIAARLYRDPRLWRRIAETNPRLDPRRLPIGHSISLPEPDSAQ